jgi:hypothetical protein
MTSRLSSLRRLFACALALALWAGDLSAQSDKPGSTTPGPGPSPTGRDNDSFSSGDSSGGGELPKTGGSGAGPGGAGAGPFKPTMKKPPTTPATPPVAPPSSWTGWGGQTSPGGGSTGGGGTGGGGTGGGGGGTGGTGGGGDGSGGSGDGLDDGSTDGSTGGTGGDSAEILTFVRLLDEHGRPLHRAIVGVVDESGHVLALARANRHGLAALRTPAGNDLSLFVVPLGERTAIEMPLHAGRPHLLLIDA